MYVYRNVLKWSQNGTGGEKMKPVRIETKKAVIIIYPPTVSEKEKARLLEEIAQIKATW